MSREERAMKQPTFELRNRIFPYFPILTYDLIPGEKAVELPVALHIYSEFRGRAKFLEDKIDILEIGAVLPQVLPKWESEPVPNKKYSVFPHTVIDPRVPSEAEGIGKIRLLQSVGDKYKK